MSALQNRLLLIGLSEFHSGYRVYATRALRRIPFERNTNGFHFDTEIIIQLTFVGQRIIEYPIPTYYGDEICPVNACNTPTMCCASHFRPRSSGLLFSTIGASIASRSKPASNAPQN